MVPFILVKRSDEVQYVWSVFDNNQAKQQRFITVSGVH